MAIKITRPTHTSSESQPERATAGGDGSAAPQALHEDLPGHHRMHASAAKPILLGRTIPVDSTRDSLKTARNTRGPRQTEILFFSRLQFNRVQFNTR